jgi:hypothetical protein
MRRLLLTLALLALVAAQAPAAHAQSAAVQNAVAWLRQQQQPDGSFPGFGAGDTADAVAALVAAGERPADFVKDGKTPLDYLKAQAAAYAATGPGAAAKLTLAAVAAGENPAAFGGVNLLEQLGKSYDPQTGQYGPDVYGHGLAMLAARAVGATPADPAVQRLLSLQLEDGGWSFDGTAATGSDTNTTSVAVQALAALPAADAARARAAAYLKGQQNDDGGFPYSQTSQFGNASDANSTAAAIQAIVALGQDPAGADWTKGASTPLTALAAFQNESGGFRYQAAQPDDNALATYQAIPALLGKALPVATAAVSGADALLAPAGAPAPAATPAPAPQAPATTPAALPATGAGAEAPLAALALAALALLGLGLAARRRAAP